MRKSTIERKVCGKTMHIRKGSFAHYAIDWGVHIVTVAMFCVLLVQIGFIAGWNF